MPKDESILRAASEIRILLKEVIPEHAEELDQCLSDRLNAAKRGESVTNKILQDLRRWPETREWLGKFLKDEELSVSRDAGFEPPLGDPGVIGATQYVCPLGDYTWYQISAGSAVPKCPVHGITLVSKS